MPATQAKTDANKADEASPFALLVGHAQAKPTAQQKDTQSKDDQNSGDGQNDTTGNTSQTNAAAIAAQTLPQAPGTPVKADKSGDKNSKDKDDDSSDTSNESAAAAALQQASLQQQPQPPAQIAITAANAAITAASDDASGDEPGVTAAGAVGVAASGQGKTQSSQTAQNTQTANQAAASQAANQASNTPGQTASAQGQPSNAQNQASNAQGQGANPQSPAATTQGMSQQAAAQNDGIALPKPWQDQTQSAGAPGNGKTDTSKTGDSKTDNVKQAAAPAPQLHAVAGNDAAASKPDATAGNAMPVIGTAQPQSQQTQGPAAPAVTQNVQVSTPAPNMPALAVEIAARSLSGAKQFDIRLDPPELGRVEVRLSIDATGKASAHLSADQPQTLNLLQKDAPALTRALRDAGLNVAQNGLNFSLRQQSSDSGAGSGQSRGGSGRSFTLTATSSIDATSASAAYRAPADGRLDIRV